MIAKFFENMGFNLGNVTWNSAVNAGGEDAIVVCINRRLYSCKLTHRNISRCILKNGRNIANLKISVVKDPRFTWPGVLEEWLKIRRDLKFLILTRNFNDVLASRERMENAYDLQDPRKYTIDRLQTDFRNFLDILQKNNLKYTVISFPSIIDEYDLFYSSVEYLGYNSFSRGEGRKIWEKTVDKRMVHEKEDSL